MVPAAGGQVRLTGGGQERTASASVVVAPTKKIYPSNPQIVVSRLPSEIKVAIEVFTYVWRNL